MTRALEEVLERAAFASHVTSAVHRVADAMRLGEPEVLFATMLDVMRGLVDADSGCLLVEVGPGEFRFGAELGVSVDWALAAIADDGLPLIGPDGVAVRETRVSSFWATVVPLGTTIGARAIVVLVSNDHAAGSARKELMLTLAPIVGAAIESAIVARRQCDLARLQSEMALAQRVQARLQPMAPADFRGYRFATYCRSCDETGGDYYDFVGGGLDRMTVMLGDVSGHGLGAALMMLSVRASIRAHLSTERAPDALFSMVNRTICLDDFDGRYLTLFCAVLGAKAGELEYASAGQECPLLFRCSGDVEELESTGMPLGLFAEAEWSLGRVMLAPGDLVLMASDGVIEAMAPSGEFFGRERLVSVVAAARATGASGIVAALQREVATFCGGAYRDDVTMVVIEVIGQ
jgi:phosphoserine phosphatase RsbU/P